MNTHSSLGSQEQKKILRENAPFHSQKSCLEDYSRQEKNGRGKKKGGIKATGISHQAEIHHFIRCIARGIKQGPRKKQPRKPTAQSKHPTVCDHGFSTS